MVTLSIIIGAALFLILAVVTTLATDHALSSPRRGPGDYRRRPVQPSYPREPR